MRLPVQRRRDVIALLVATATALAGLTTWLLGDVDLGVRLDVNGDGFVYVSEVMPDSYAESYGFYPGVLVMELQKRDGSMAAQRASEIPNRNDVEQPYPQVHLVTEWVPEEQIESLYAIDTDGQRSAYILWGSTLNRYGAAADLAYAGILLLVGIGLGIALAAIISRGWLGEQWRGEASVTAVAAATPLLALPLTASGVTIARVAGDVLPMVALVPLAWSLADAFPSTAWRPRLRFAVVGLATIALLVPLQLLMGRPFTDREPLLLAASVTAIPATALALSGALPFNERLHALVIGFLPAAAILSHAGSRPELLPLVLVVGAFGAWRLIPASISLRLPRRHPAGGVGPMGGADEALDDEDPATRARRDTSALILAAVTFVAGLASCCNGDAVILGALAGAVAAFALDRGLLGPAWARAAIPLGCAIAVPLMALGFSADGLPAYGARLVLPGAAALPVAQLLAWRHPDPAWRRLLFGISVALVFVVGVIVIGSSYGGPLLYGPYEYTDTSRRLTIYLVLGAIALLPGLGAALSDPGRGGMATTSRLDLVAIGITPGAAMTVLPGSSPNVFLLAGWVLALVAWRRLTIAPLLGLAQRTQRQRDLAVAAVEAERARLAADIHDDALQELSALVRRLDAAGDAEGADLARGVAERLRTITSDLRLPLLDDLGAGPALEWLVGRVRPLADGEVTLERTDLARPPANVELAVFRVAQEAIANAVKHGKTPITVRYRVADDGGVSLTIDDEGPGIEPDAAELALQAGHLGVANMQQRAQQIGALLDIRRWPSGGTHVALEWRPR